MAVVSGPLSDLVLAALVALHPGPGGTDASRREAADAIAQAATDQPLWPVAAEAAEGSPEVAATALMLAAIAQHESALDPAVGSCKRPGMGGAITYFQLMPGFSFDGHEKKDICASTPLAARLALRVLRVHMKRCKNCPPSRWLNAYASGNPGRGSRASRETMELWVKLSDHARLRVFPLATTAPAWR